MKLLAATALAALMACPVLAQGSNCAPRSIAVAGLAEKYGETPRMLGIGSGGVVVEVFASDETGTWTITVTRPDGFTCFLGAGQSFENIPAPAPGDDL